MLASRDTLLAALAARVRVGMIAWRDPSCAARFGAATTVVGSARGELATCLAGLRLSRARIDTGSAVAAIGEAGDVIALELRGGRIAALDAAAPDPRDSKFPTVLRWWVNRELTPAPATRLAIARTPKRYVDAIFKICHDEHGTVTSRRIVRPSGLPAFDAEALAYFRTVDHLEPYQGAGTPAPACSILAFRYPELLAGDRLAEPGAPPAPSPGTSPPR